ncbi:MAG: hypothetical protein ILP13_02175 [Lachnospiraceae bacterium]|nr:hypothetical protein [Lachnospiraceae bacterium]
MNNNTAKKYMNIPMDKALYNRAFCKEMAMEIAESEQITGMSLSQLACEIFAHAYVYYNFRFIPRFLKGLKLFKSVYGSVENGVDLEDNGDKWYRRIAYRFIWFFPAFAI